MTDNEIIKALECCIKDNCDCGECPAIPVCQHDFDCPKTIALELINRQKAEIERLNGNLKFVRGTVERQRVDINNLNKAIDNYEACLKSIEKIKVEAYKEFAENAVKRVEKAKLKYQKLCKEQGEEMEEHMHIHFNGIIGIINNLLKEMAGDNNARDNF